MFRHLPASHHAEEDLAALAEAMQGEGPRGDRRLGHEDAAENLAIPAGYTYLGQFIDHDLSFDPVASFDRQNDPQARINFRTPRFDLDSVYGRGPADQPYLYRDDRRFLLGKPLTDGGREQLKISVDLPRNARGRALVGDPRNDENKIVSQLHAVMLRFHNALVARLTSDRVPSDDVFSEAQRLVRWHYQWVVLHDFLPKITGPEAIRRARAGRAFYAPRRSAFIPAELSGAVYRMGHSMVRPSYLFNDNIRPPSAGQGSPADHEPYRFPIFSNALGDRRADLRGFGEFPGDWGFQWKYFFGPSAGEGLPQPSYRIDSSLSEPLASLQVVGVVGNAPVSLAARNLLRGNQLALPGGQDVALALELNPLTEEQLFDEVPVLRGEPGRKAAPHRLPPRARAALRHRTPLWYYILREAEVDNGGTHLGPVGARIVAEVFVGLLQEDRHTFLNQAPRWRPRPEDMRDDRFEMIDLIRIASEDPLP
jgi:hypothetical protein